MKTLKTRKNRKGFTLVELIVVIAILAILAGVAIPVYSGYIAKANEAADYTALDAVKTAAVFAFTEKHPESPVTTISYTEGTTTVNVTSGTGTSAITEPALSIESYIAEGGVTLKTGSSASWEIDATTGQGKWTIND